MDEQNGSRDLNAEPDPPAQHLRPVPGSRKKRAGPKTPQGKARSSRNATGSGFYATDPVIPGERRKEWEAHRAGILASANCVNALQAFHADRMALAAWGLNRVTKAERAAFTRANEAEREFSLPPSTELEKIQRAEAHLTRLFNQHEDRLRALQERGGGEAPPPTRSEGPGTAEPPTGPN